MPILLDNFPPGPLMDGELELIAPRPDAVDAFLAAGAHPLTQCYMPGFKPPSREQLIEQIAAAPDGFYIGNAAEGIIPARAFWMRIHPDNTIAGTISLRLSDSVQTRMYYGHVGYSVFPPSRGHRYAFRACRLLIPLAARHQLDPLWITTNPDNAASCRTCELLGATLVETVMVPPGHPLQARGDVAKHRYRLDLTPLLAHP